MRDNIALNYGNMTAEALGEFGACNKDFTDLTEKINQAISKMETTPLGFKKLPFKQDIIDNMASLGKTIREESDCFILLGIGGSALGPKALIESCIHPLYNRLEKDKRGGPQYYVEDNVDPEKIAAILELVDFNKTCINIVSKSGNTIETIAQMMIIIDALQKTVGNGWNEHVIITTNDTNGTLLSIAKEYNIKTINIPDDVGGRFSLFTPVGLLAGAVLGCDIKVLLEGARDMDALCENKDFTKNPAYMYAILQVINMKKGRNISVMMPYCESLKYISDWFCQLWAESLGKKHNIFGEIVNTGQTPVRAVGATDQHSQLQLYAEGPDDKVITFIGVKKFRRDIEIPNIFNDREDINFLCGSTLTKLINSELKAIEIALSDANRPNMTISLPTIDEYYIGQLFYMLEIATTFAGYLLDINPFDQPGVEDGKISTLAYMGKAGYEKRKSELQSRKELKNKYTINN